MNWYLNRALTLGLAIAASGVALAQTKVIEYGNNIVRVVKGELCSQAEGRKSYSVVVQPERAANPSFRYEVDDNGLVTFFDLQGGVLLKEQKSDSGERSAGSQSWLLSEDECIYGLGQQKLTDLNMRGKRIRIWNDYTIISIPYFASEKGYGVYWDYAGECWFDDNEHGTSFTNVLDAPVDYYFIYLDGTQDGLMAGVRQLSGEAVMYPLWTTGFWQCRERYRSPEQLCGVLDEYRSRRVPLDGIIQDWQYWGPDSNWNSMRFDNPAYTDKAKDMVDYVHKNHAHIMISIWPDFGPLTPQFRELSKMDALLPFVTWPQDPSGARVYDAYNPKARQLYWDYLQHLYKTGFDAWWTDSTEPDQKTNPDDNMFPTYDGPWKAVHNAFPMVTNRGIYDRHRKTYGQKRAFNMTRSGTFGLQHYGGLCWSGDVQSTWTELKNQIPSGLNFSICGNPYWNTDLGGFFCWDYDNNPKDPFAKELNTRWHQWGTFQPLMRSHCSSPMVCEIYQFGDEGDWAYDAIKEAIQLRYRLIPYIYSMEGGVSLHAGSIMRPFVFDFPHDRRAIRVADEYMFGRNLLVRPVTDPLYTWQDDQKHGHAMHPDVKSLSQAVEVYLPEGCEWYNYWTSHRCKGGKTYRVPAPINQIPVFVKAGSIMPWGPDVQYTGEKDWSSLDVTVYPGADGDFTLYEDEGDGYGYEKGHYTEISFHWDDASRSLTIADRKGSYKGMLSQRIFNVSVLNSTPNPITYTGRQLTVTL